jgi:hypothetical protein
MTSSCDWMRFIGLPYKLGADPLNGQATDCLHLCFRTIEMGPVPVPPIKRQWYLHLARKELDPIIEDWFELTEQTNGPEDYAMTLLKDEGNFSIATVIDDGLLFVRRSTGAAWAPLSSLRPMNFRRFPT